MEVYEIEFSNSKKYIGITSKTTEERIKGHIKESKNPRSSHRLVYKAMNKYSYTYRKIDEADSWEELQELEKKYVKKLNTFFELGNGYNMTKGGDGTFGVRYSRTEDFKRNLSESRKGSKNPMYGKSLSEESKRKRAKTIKERGVSFDTRSREVKVIYPNKDIKYFKNAKTAESETGITNINKYARGEYNHLHRKSGFKFYYTDLDKKGGVL